VSTLSQAESISITPEKGNNVYRKFSRFLHIPAFRTTLRTMFRVPVTDLFHPVHASTHSHYPSVNTRYRGLLALSQECCTGCKKCERICPNKTIIMEARMIDGKEQRFPGYFSGRCMLCGLCEEVCDRQFAIRHTDQFEDAAYNRQQLYYGPERMFDMWEKHIEPKIRAQMTHKGVPDKKRWGDKDIHDPEVTKDRPPVELTDSAKEQVAKVSKQI